MSNNELEFSVSANDGNRVFVDQYDDGVWLSMTVRGGSAYTTMTRKAAAELVKALEAILASEPA